MKIKKTHRSFGGETAFCEHDSASTKTKMNFAYHRPCPLGEVEKVVIWLSGLTCTEENFITKSFVQKYLEGTKTMVVAPDTSPRGLDLKDEHESYDFGSGASFYVNATTEGYKDHYQMYDYIKKDLVELIKDEFKVTRLGIMGHSMGGHGALVFGLKEPKLFETVSAFSPIVNPVACPWGEKAFTGYLGTDKDQWKEYDSVEILKSQGPIETKLLVDQGTADQFFEQHQLLTQNLENTCKEVKQDCEIRYQEGYDHSYYFISTFLESHINHHTKQ